jgi:serine/threonine-protein kinase
LQLETGTLLLHYRLVEKLGEGGMGIVWRAVDTTLDRDVAVKILPDVFANDPDRSARFEREAKVLASLNHPNITTVHSVHAVGGIRFLVMELAHGEDLAARLARGPLPLDEVLKIARQLAEALEAAHESGVVHRDLKPANITVTEEGKVEVLDFGLAKALDPSASGPIADLSKSPTLASGHTAAGMIIGTAAYMSPEQARGKPVDRRADIWAFGCVLYEMLSRRKAFDGETVTDVLAAVVTRGPDWSAVPADTPRRLLDLLHRCLEKDPARRLRDAGEARIVLDDLIARPASNLAEAAPIPRPKPAWPRALPWLVAAAGLAAAAFALLGPRGGREPLEPTRLSVALPPTDVIDGGFENLVLNISRDGRAIAYTARRDGIIRLYVRRMGDGEATELKGTEEAHSPFFSPDGEWIAFMAQAKLRKVPAAGGPVFDVCDVTADRSGVWLDDGSIVVATHATQPLMQVSSSGGVPRAVTVLDSARGERTHRWPDALPGGEWVIFTIGSDRSPGDYEEATIAAASLKTGERRVLVEGASMARYCAPGYLVFSRRGALLAAPMDASDPKLTGQPVPFLDNIDREPSSGAVHFALARSGTLVFAPKLEGAELGSLVWVDHAGNTTALAAPPREYLAPRISPDGRQVFVTIGPGYGAGDVWRYDIPRRTLTRLTFDGKSLVAYVTPDQRRVVYTSEDVSFRVLSQALEGDSLRKLVYESRQPLVVSGLSPDGRWVLFNPWGAQESDILMVPSQGGGEARVVVSEPFDQSDATVSPDGRWIAYVSRQSGLDEVFVRAFPSGAGKWQASSGGALMPLWSPTRRELYWIGGPSMYAVDYEAAGNTISFGTPRKLFDLPAGRRADADVLPYDLAPDGSHFLMTRIAHPEFARRRIDVILDFPAQLRGMARKGIAP